MEKNEEKRLGYRRWGLDRLTNLPECLRLQILSKLPTKDVVKTSVLSSRWRNLWRYVPALDLQCSDFFVHEQDNCSCGQDMCNCEDLGFVAFVSFVDKFLAFNTQLCIQKFRFKVNWDEAVPLDVAHFTRLFNSILERKVRHLHVLDKTLGLNSVEVPSTVYTCESLVSLNLCDVYLPNPNRVSLPCVKVINLDKVEFSNDWAFEMLISGCSVLESLTICLDCYSRDNVETYRLCSHSLLSFTHVVDNLEDLYEDRAVVIDAPRLERLRLSDHRTARFIIKNLASLVEADVDFIFNLCFGKKLHEIDLPRRNMIRNFLVGISCIKDMKISSSTLQVIYDYSRWESLPLFRNLSFLRVEFYDYDWEVLPIFLESCPNLKSLTLGFDNPPREEDEGVNILPGPPQFLTSLEYVTIVKPMAKEAAETTLELVSYFLENSTILKKFTLCAGHLRRNFITELLTIPRLSSSCRVYVV